MSNPSNGRQPLDPAILECLADVMDPEIGLSVVDLGLVYQATLMPDAVEVALTLTTRACPLGEMIVDDVRERLAHRFQGVPRVDVRLVWDPVWKPDFVTARGQELLGRSLRNAI